jgi:glycosyltransferase involved in cell wall biosynthesis
MRIGFDARSLFIPEPIAYNRYTANLLRGLHAHGGIELFLFTDQKRPIHDSYLAGLPATVLTLPLSRQVLWEQVQLPIALRRHRVQVYHAPADQLLPAVKACRYVVTRHSVPYESYFERLLERGDLPGTIEDYLGDLNPGHSAARQKYLRGRAHILRSITARSADRIITVSETTRRELESLVGLPGKKLRVTHLAADPEFSAPIGSDIITSTQGKFGIPAEYILSVGTVAQIKNTTGLLRVYAALKAGGETRPLVICAPAIRDLAYFNHTAEQLSLQEKKDYFLLSGVGRDLPALYRGATLFVILSWYESFSFPAVEAMSCGLPIVASNFACIPEIVHDAAIVVDPRNVDEVAATIAAVLGSPAAQRELRTKALRRSKAFSWERTVAETVVVYDELLHQDRFVSS